MKSPFVCVCRCSSGVPLLCVFIAFFTVGCGDAAEPDAKSLPPDCAKLLPLHTKLGKPKPGDWLAEHAESGQTFRQYVRSGPIRADRQRRTIYIQPLGELTPTQKKIVDRTVEFMGVYFQLPVQRGKTIPLDVVPASARRTPGGERPEQLLTTYVLDRVLKPRLPQDAVALIALTASDLWPGEGWNFVFGQASLADRVGLWSLNRFGDPDHDADAYRLCLVRTLKTATHETGHMFSMDHCTFFECNMCGSNHLPEGDSHPLELCPNCLAKLRYATGARPTKRFEQLIEFYKANGLKSEREFCERSLAALKKR
jgi:archaemetzincin